MTRVPFSSLITAMAVTNSPGHRPSWPLARHPFQEHGWRAQGQQRPALGGDEGAETV